MLHDRYRDRLLTRRATCLKCVLGSNGRAQLLFFFLVGVDIYLIITFAQRNVLVSYTDWNNDFKSIVLKEDLP